jgi:MFS family permease
MYGGAEFAICAGGFGFFVILFALIILLRYLNYKETLALAEKGLVRPEVEAKNGKGNLKTGIILSSIGLALILGMLPFGVHSSYPGGFGPWMILGLLPLFIGLGLVLIHVVTREPKGKGEKK